MPPPNHAPRQPAAPAHSKRRIWSRPTLLSHPFLVLTQDELYLGADADEPNPELLALVRDGADLEQTIGSRAAAVNLTAIRRLKLDMMANTLVVEHGGADGAGEEVLTFATTEAADSCFSKLWRRLGDGLRLVPHQRDRWSLARGPLLLLAGALLATAVLTAALSILADSGPDAAGGSKLAALLGRLDWRIVCAAGGAIAAVSQVWLYRRLTAPPAELELVRH